MTEDAKQPLRIVIVGHVDHGKSTLIGRLLNDTGSLMPGKVEEVQAACARRNVPFEWSFLLDAFQDERDQAITIDTTQIRFNHQGRDYTIIDAPGHKEFLRNMVSGAASADAAVLVVDAGEGLKEQTRRHAYLINLLGLRQVAVVVNKMDSVDYSEDRFNEVKKEIGDYFSEFGVTPAAIIPISARNGEGLTEPSQNMPWHQGGSLMSNLDSFDRQPEPVARPLRFSVQDVYRANEKRIVVGRVESGTMREGDTITIMPTNATTKIKKFMSWPDNGQELSEVSAGDVVGFTTEDPVFVNRGQIISHSDSPPTLTNTFNARVFWLHDTPITVGQSLEARFTTARVPVTVQSINRVVNTDDLALGEGARSVPKNGVAEITFRASKSLPLDDYNDDGKTGRVALSLDGMNIHGGGIISLKEVMAARKQAPKSANLTAVEHMTSEDLRKEKFGHGGGVFWFTGLSGAGKSTLAMRVEKALIDRGINSMVLDGDNVRNGLNKDLGFSPQDRKENIRRVGEVAALMAQAGVACVTAFISPYQADRDMAREACKGTFHEIYIKADVDTCEGRDPKGLYKKARAGLIQEFTGVSAPYEAPVNPELTIDTETNTVEACVAQIVAYIEQQIKPSLQPEPEKVISFSSGANEDRKQIIRA